jgi:SAM-dependent methyltransferase
MDASEHAVNVAREQYGLDVQQGAIGSGAWDGCYFDFVTMFHVLEHVPEPRKALQFACGRLKPDGSLIIQVPNVGSLQARLFASRWYGLDVPRHVINYSPDALRRILAQAELQVSAVKRFSLRDNPASVASSLLPGLDPLGRKVRKRSAAPILELFLELAYLGLLLCSLPIALAETACGCGGTLWVQAKRRQ